MKLGEGRTLKKRAARSLAKFGAFSLIACAILFFGCPGAYASIAGSGNSNELRVVSDQQAEATIVCSPAAGKWERAAANDLVHYVKMMTGVTLPIAETKASIELAIASGRPLLVLGQEALAARPDLRSRIATVLKPNPAIRSDGIVLLREGNMVYIAGNSDEAHYFAVAELLRRWGVRWFMPGDFGESVPEEATLSVGDLSYVFSSPFDVRSYWVSWLGHQAGHGLFHKRNMMNDVALAPPHGHALGEYTKGLGKSEFDVPLADPRTADQVAAKVEGSYSAGKDFSLSISDGIYDPPDEASRKLIRMQWDKQFLSWSVTDAILALYSKVAAKLRERYPSSASRIGFLIYSNMTLPPVLDAAIDPMFFGVLAPIDFDPIHSMDDSRAPEKGDLRWIMGKWGELLSGRLAIYDYDQSMLVWRDLPNPSHMAFARDVQIYRDAGVAGFVTESRNALATTFINLYMRGRLMWDPEADPQALLNDFYPRFFGPAAKPMKAYWETINRAWRDTIVKEHEYFIAPAIYSPELVEGLRRHLQSAEDALVALRARPQATLGRNERLYLERLKFMRLSFEVLRNYMNMVRSAATEADYLAAARSGEAGLQARDELTAMNAAFTTTRLESGYAFWPGEVQQYRELLPFLDGEKGDLIAKLPLEWAFRRDPKGEGEKRGFAAGPIDLTYWRAHHDELTMETRKDYPDEWETLRTDLYVQAQGVRLPDQRNYVGDIWYRTSFDLTPEQVATSPHLMFPGLFNACDLFIGGRKIASREQKPLWWQNDYRFQWDVSLTGHVAAGENDLALRCHVPVHMGGIFRRPFLYAARGAN